VFVGLEYKSRSVIFYAKQSGLKYTMAISERLAFRTSRIKGPVSDYNSPILASSMQLALHWRLPIKVSGARRTKGQIRQLF
jgi:hypothetical protein